MPRQVAGAKDGVSYVWGGDHDEVPHVLNAVARRAVPTLKLQISKGNKTANVDHINMEAHMAVFGYARVSTDGQTLASQDAELMAAGCAKVFAEKVSGARNSSLLGIIDHIS
jgi:Resolvase, N terminal domain